MTERFRVGLSGDFRNADGSPTFRDFDLAPLIDDPGIEMSFLEPQSVLGARQLENIDALILLAHRFDRDSVPKSGRLGVIARFGVGYDTVDVKACTDAGIALVITPESVRRPVAVSIITLMLALTGKLTIKEKLTRAGAAGFAQRGAHMGVGLVGRTFGSLGVGNIGAEAFRLATPFDMKFIAHDPFADTAAMAKIGVELVGIADLFRRSDVLSISCPLTDATRHIVNAEMLALMKPASYLINTARGPVVDQKALTRALQERRIAGAGLDVLEQEPPDPGDPILALDNVIATPHALCWTDQCFAHQGALDIQAVLEFRDGRAPTGTIVNRPVLESQSWQERILAVRARLGN
ncbi:MAG TPA: NAD(P)-dependent oxidoreductase [Rhizomicrobium sp.]|nr:NAD(P)-dependent oxidoreductase [Rhizomicrobium sp.]